MDRKCRRFEKPLLSQLMKPKITCRETAIGQRRHRPRRRILGIAEIDRRDQRALRQFHQVKRRLDARVVQFTELVVLERFERETIGVSMQTRREKAQGKKLFLESQRRDAGSRR